MLEKLVLSLLFALLRPFVLLVLVEFYEVALELRDPLLNVRAVLLHFGEKEKVVDNPRHNEERDKSDDFLRHGDLRKFLRQLLEFIDIDPFSRHRYRLAPGAPTARAALVSPAAPAAPDAAPGDAPPVFVSGALGGASPSRPAFSASITAFGA
jgi:hypothetical protein